MSDTVSQASTLPNRDLAAPVLSAALAYDAAWSRHTSEREHVRCLNDLRQVTRAYRVATGQPLPVKCAVYACEAIIEYDGDYCEEHHY